VDVHVHLREPGYEYKETIKTGTMSAAAGGYTTICCMPNTKPIIDNLSTLNNLKKLIKQKAIVNILPYASITKQEKGQALVNIPSLAKHCFAFSDDGVGIASSDLMFKAMQQCKKVNKVIVAHCEDISQKNSNAKESKEVERNLKLASKTKCQLHICHVSTHESINLIKKAKAQKVNVSCEVTPHHLLLNKNNVINQGTYKMNPPLANPKDQQVLKKALADGTIDMIVTDHAPHADKEKNTTYEKSLNGIVGLETAFSLIYTHFVKTKAISFSRMINLMSLNPCKIFKIKSHQIILNNTANITIMDLNTK
jgi:dihydroorotase